MTTRQLALRVFLAIPADPAWVESARDLVRRLRAELPGASWTRPESWHVTLHFLGDVSKEEADRFAAAIAPGARATPEGHLAAGGAVIFPPRGPARILAAGFAESPCAAALSILAETAAALAPSTGNSKPETRNFRPHITFARIRRPWPPEAVERYRAALGEWPAPDWLARSCVLFQSRLTPGGAVHRPLETWSFAASSMQVRA